jgi:HAD superfamily hydrolase (TIGR01490 family)
MPDAGPRVTRVAAFFDVDETLITAKSMFDFLRDWLARDRSPEVADAECAAVLRQVREAAAAGVDRTEVNRGYYRRFAGEPWAELSAAGAAWYAAYRRRPRAYVAESTAALAAHVAAGDTVVLVSGSFRGCLEPLAAHLGAHRILCSEPLVDAAGLLTGEVRRPMIGPAKADGVSETIAALGLRAADCHAYGDHSSDLGMLQRVGHPHVVGADPVLRAEAARRGWPVLTATPTEAPAGVSARPTETPAGAPATPTGTPADTGRAVPETPLPPGGAGRGERVEQLS